MMLLPNWSQTQVHHHTRAYGCARCPKTFASPQAVYIHLTKIHPATGFELPPSHLSPSEVLVGGKGRVGSKSRQGRIAASGPNGQLSGEVRAG